jgi:hypothetical protein
LLTNAC